MAQQKGKIGLNIEGMMVEPKDYLEFVEEGYGKRHFVREGDRYKEVTNPKVTPVRVHKDRSYTTKDTESFIAYVDKYGNPKTGIIFCQDAGLEMYFDESSRTEKVILPFEYSLEYRTFFQRGNDERHFSQKEFVKALETFPDIIEGADLLLPNIERLKLEATVEFESNLDDRDHVFMYREKGGSQTARIPKQLILRLPVFEKAKNKMTVLADLEIQRPKSAEDKPVFILRDPRRERTIRTAMEAEVDTIKKALKNWMFVWGSTNRDRHCM